MLHELFLRLPTLNVWYRLVGSRVSERFENGNNFHFAK